MKKYIVIIILAFLPFSMDAQLKKKFNRKSGATVQKAQKKWNKTNRKQFTRTQFNHRAGATAQKSTQIRRKHHKRPPIQTAFNGKSRLPRVQNHSLFSRGSTGRAIPRNKMERDALKAWKNNPGNSIKRLTTIGRKSKGDPRWKGWTKFSHKVSKDVYIHFNRKKMSNGTFRYDDIKFKDYRNQKLNNLKSKGTLSHKFNKKAKKTGRSPFSQFYKASKK